MTRTRWILALLFGFTVSAEASAQVVAVPVIAQGGIGFHVGGQRLRIDGFFPFGNPYGAVLPVTPTPFGLRQAGPAYLPYYPYGAIDRRVTLQVINPPRVSLTPNRERVDLSGIDLDVEPPSKIWGEKPGLAKAEGVKAPAAPKKVDAAAVNPAKPPVPIPPAKIEPVLTEGQQLCNQGIDAFKAGEFGLALLRFRQADEAIPPGPRAAFYQGQAYIAVGKYREAADILQQALRRNANWPASGFRPKDELYGNQDAAWKEHRQRLEQAQKLRPKNADYLFLLGYVNWFDGDRVAAADYFQQSRALAADPRWCDLFLKVAAAK